MNLGIVAVCFVLAAKLFHPVNSLKMTIIATKPTPNTNQQICIDNTEGKYLVLAGPGTGKTFTIVERIKNMLNKGIQAEKIHQTE